MPQISAKSRKEVGKKLNPLRKSGALPAVLYGRDVASVPLSVSAKEFEKVLNEAGETSLVTLKIEGGKDYNVLIHDVAKDPRTLEPIHADFFAVEMDKPIEAKVTIVFTDESPAVKNEGGILVKVLHELEVKALPRDLPHEIKVSLSGLEKIEDRLYVRDIKLPEGVSTHVHPEEVIAVVEPPRSESDIEAVTKAEEAAPVAEVKTERETKAEMKEAKGTEEDERTEK